MQAVRTAPVVGRQLRRLGVGRCVFDRRDGAGVASDLGTGPGLKPPLPHSSWPRALLGQPPLGLARRPYASGATQVSDGGLGRGVWE